MKKLNFTQWLQYLKLSQHNLKVFVRLKYFALLLLATSCNMQYTYSGKFEYCKVLTVDYSASHYTYYYINKRVNPVYHAASWNAKVLINTELTTIIFDANPNLKNDSTYKLLILK